MKQLSAARPGRARGGRDHLAHDLETLVEFVAPFANGYHDAGGVTRPNEVVIWFDAQIVTAVLDDVSRRDFVTCVNLGELSSQDVAKKLVGLAAHWGVQADVRIYHGRYSREEAMAALSVIVSGGPVRGGPCRETPAGVVA